MTNIGAACLPWRKSSERSKRRFWVLLPIKPLSNIKKDLTANLRSFFAWFAIGVVITLHKAYDYDAKKQSPIEALPNPSSILDLASHLVNILYMYRSRVAHVTRAHFTLSFVGTLLPRFLNSSSVTISWLMWLIENSFCYDRTDLHPLGSLRLKKQKETIYVALTDYNKANKKRRLHAQVDPCR